MPPHATTATRRRSLDTISVWALLITLIVGIFVAIPSASIPFIATKTFLLGAGALITLALYILARLSRGNMIFPPWLLVAALWLPAFAYLLSTIFSGVIFSNAFWGTSLEPDTLGFMLIASILGTLAALLVRRPENYRSFLRVGAVAFLVLVVLQILFLIVGQFAPNTIAPTLSLVGSFDDLSALLGLGVVSALIAFRFLELPKRARRLMLVALVGALFVLAVANSTLTWTLLALVSLGLFVESVMRRSPSNTSGADLDDIGATHISSSAPLEPEEGGRPLVMPLIVLAVSLFFLIGGTLGQALANSLHASVVSVRPSWQSTLLVVQKTYSSSPVFGTGPGTFGIEWLKYRDASLNSTIFWNTDFASGIGFIPTSFATTGIVGALAWIAFLALLIFFGLRTLIQRAPKDGFTRTVGVLSFVSAIYLFTDAIFSLPNAVILALAFVFTGLFISTTRFAEGNAQWGIIFSRSPRIGFIIVFSLTLVLLGSVVAAYTLVGHYVAAAELTSANATLNSSGNLDTADKAAQNSLSFAQSASAYELQASIASARLNQIVASASSQNAATAQQAFQTALSGGINAALTATRLAPNDYQSWILLGNLYAQAVPLNVSGAYDSAKTAYQKAEALNPTNPQIPYVLAQLNIANKNNAEAEADLKTAIGLKQDYTAAIFLSQLEVQDGNLKDALNAALAAAYFTPTDPNVLFQVGILQAASNNLPAAVNALSAAIEANAQFANARYFLAAVYAKQADYKDALVQMQAIAAMSDDNAKAVAAQITALEANKDPFPANLLSVTPAVPAANPPAAKQQ